MPPRMIRKRINRNITELIRCGIISVLEQNAGKPARPPKACYLNEEQALLMCMFSKTENAALTERRCRRGLDGIRKTLDDLVRM